MGKFRVSVNVVRCCDVYVDAENVEAAKQMVLEEFLWQRENDKAWCSGHLGTQEVDEAVAVDADGNEI